MTAAGAFHGARKLRAPGTRRSTWFGGEGKAKSQAGAPRRTGSHESGARLRVRFVDRGRQHSLAHQASARL